MKGKCKYSKLVNAYLDGELPKKKVGKFKAHLHECSICQNELRRINTLNGFLSKYKTEEMPRTAYKEILKETGEVKKHLKTIVLFHKISKISVAASIVLAFVAGILVSNKTFASNSDTTNIEFADNSFYEYLDLGE